jgi:hypothetical protein
MLEWIGSNLDPQVYFPHLPKVLQDVQGEIHEEFYNVLEKLEESIRKDILNLKDELQRGQEAGVAVRVQSPSLDPTLLTMLKEISSPVNIAGSRTLGTYRQHRRRGRSNWGSSSGEGLCLYGFKRSTPLRTLPATGISA